MIITKELGVIVSVGIGSSFRPYISIQHKYGTDMNFFTKISLRQFLDDFKIDNLEELYGRFCEVEYKDSGFGAKGCTFKRMCTQEETESIQKILKQGVPVGRVNSNIHLMTRVKKKIG